jgi:RNA polymerase-associated protein RTF1
LYRRKEEKVTTVADSKNKRKAPASKDSKKKSRTEKDEDLAKKLAGTRSSARTKDVSGAKSKKAAALAALKRQRKIQQDMEESSSDGSELDFGDDDEDSDEDYEEAGLKPWQIKAKAADKTATKASTTSRTSRDDGVDDSDMDIDDDGNLKVGAKSRSRSSAGATTISASDAGLEDFLKVTIPRRRLAQWCNEPFFDAAVLECFVRLFIGEDGNGEKVYRLCEIVDVKVDKRSYKFPVTDKNEKPLSTNKFLRLKFGNNERDFPMNLVSDTPPTELDVQKYLTTQKNNRSECLSKRRATKLRRTQDHLVTNYNYTTEDIERSLMQRKKDGKSMSKLGATQTKIAVAVKAAKDELLDAERRLTEAKKALVEFSGNAHEENELEKALEDCTRAVEVARKELNDLLKEEEKTLEAVKNRTMKLAGREKDQNWAKVNRRALQINQKVDRESYKVQKEIDARKAAGEKEKFNPYARRKVKPKILWEVGQAKEDDAMKTDGTSNVEVTMHAATHDTLIEKVTTPSLVNSETNRNAASLLVSESHQFVIDEEGLAAQQLSSNYQDKEEAATTGATRIARIRKGISMSQYLQRKGLV